MGAWGPGLYQNDVTCDMKEEYINRLKVGYSNIEATQEVIDYNMDSIEDMEEGPLFWFALADIQWKYGRLLPEVKEEAIRQLKSGTDLERWKENKTQYKKRIEVLEALEQRLNSPQPPEKKVSKLIPHKAEWEPGDILLYQIHNEKFKDHKWFHKYILLMVLGITKTNMGSLPYDKYFDEQNIAIVFNWVGNSAPDLNIIKNLNYATEKDFSGKIVDLKCVLSFNKRELKKLNFTVIAKDREYSENVSSIPDLVGLGWYNIHNIDHIFIYALDRAEEAGTLNDQTKK